MSMVKSFNVLAYYIRIQLCVYSLHPNKEIEGNSDTGMTQMWNTKRKDVARNVNINLYDTDWKRNVCREYIHPFVLSKNVNLIKIALWYHSPCSQC